MRELNARLGVAVRSDIEAKQLPAQLDATLVCRDLRSVYLTYDDPGADQVHRRRAGHHR